MERKTCFIVGAGSFDGMDIRPAEGDLVIAADGGYAYLKELGIEPDVLLGDFDSLEVMPEHHHLIRHSPIKDDTDMALAAYYAQEQGYTRFFLYGGLGGRLDHTFGNLQLLNGLSRAGAEVYLIGDGVVITAITNERITFDAGAEGMISVFCFGEPATGVWERGLKYTLTDATLTCDRALGVSNEFTGEESYIEVRKGTLVLLWDEKNGLPKKREISKVETVNSGDWSWPVKTAIQYIHEHLSDKQLDISQLAEKVSLSQSRFRAVFKEETGKSPSRYLSEIRFQVAEELLLKSGLKMDDIADEAGFLDGKYFRKIFSQKYGMTPRQFRETKRGQGD